MLVLDAEGLNNKGKPWLFKKTLIYFFSFRMRKE